MTNMKSETHDMPMIYIKKNKKPVAIAQSEIDTLVNSELEFMLLNPQKQAELEAN